MFAGKITDVRRDLEGGFMCGHALVSGVDQWFGSEARIAVQNGNLILWIDGESVVSVPDLILNLERDTGEPITTEMLRFGPGVAIPGIPAQDLLKTPRASEVVGPAAFGYPNVPFYPFQDSREVQ